MDISNIFISSLTLIAPLLFALVGCLIMQKSGVLNLGVEGTMILGGLFYSIIMKNYLNISANMRFLGFLVAGLLGIGMGFIHAFLTINLKANQFLVSFIWNYLALALSTLILIGIYKQKSFNANEIFVNFIYIGNPLTLIFVFNIILILGVVAFLYLTRWGLYLKASGKSAVVLTLSQINVTKYRYFAVVVGFALSSLAGAFFVYQKGSFNISVNGMGLLAFAIIALSQWEVFRAIFFAYFITIILEMSNFWKQDFNKWWWSILPYILLLLIAPLFSWFKKDDRKPAMLNVPYVKENS